LEEAPANGDGGENDKQAGEPGVGLARTAASAKSPEFAPSDPWDSRQPYDWPSKWPKDARRAILHECIYLTVLLVGCVVGLFLLATHKLRDPLRLDPPSVHAVTIYGSAWLGGTIGGCVFSIKWLYHVIARGKWHLDRRAWRYFTPLISGALAFGTTALFIARVIPIFDRQITDRAGGVVGLSFLVGYFSDNTVAALAAAADRVLGTKTSLRRKAMDKEADGRAQSQKDERPPAADMDAASESEAKGDS
jgi:hypothetical protein